MKCLVTGGAGFIGSNLVELLIHNNYEVTVLDNFSTGFKKNLDNFSDIRLIEGDIRDRDLVDEVVVNQDAIFHLAASVGNKKSIEDPYHDASCNIQGLLNILEAMRAYKVGNIVFSSSAGIFGEPQYQPVDEKHPCEPDSPYGATKLGGEKLILSYMKLYGIRAVCLRYFNVYGINQRYDAYGNVIPIFVTKALKDEPITIYGDGEQTRDFINVKDVAKANLLAAKNANAHGLFNIGTGKAISINNLATIVKTIIGKNTPIHYATPRPGDVRHCTADVKRLTTILNVSPDLDLKKKLEEYCEWAQGDLNS